MIWSYPEVPRVPGSPAGLRLVVDLHRLDLEPYRGPARPSRWLASWSTATYLPLLGLAPRLGRSFSLEETRAAGSPKLAVIGHGFWVDRLGSDPAVLGRSIGLNGAAIHDHRRAARGLPRPDRSGRAVRAGDHAGGRRSRGEVESLLLGRGAEEGRRHGRAGRGGRETLGGVVSREIGDPAGDRRSKSGAPRPFRSTTSVSIR